MDRLLPLLLLAWAPYGAWAGLAGPEQAVPYLDPSQPFYAERAPAASIPNRPLRLVSFNIKFSEDVPGIIAAFQNDPVLQGADLIFLQEVTGTPGGPENAARTIARALGMTCVFTPAVIHPKVNEDFGNAILSRWPLFGYRRLLLPHARPGTGNRRVALGATVWIGNRALRLYSTHLETVFSDSIIPSEIFRAHQVMALLQAIREDGIDAALVAGDFNSWSPFAMIQPRRFFKQSGFTYGNPGAYFTMGPFKLDHIFGRGVRRITSGRASWVHVSDHVPVWMDFQLED